MTFVLPALLCTSFLPGADGAHHDRAAPSEHPSGPPGEEKSVVFTPDGAWCWFQDPRAVFVKGVHRRTYAAWVTSKGKLQIGAFDHASSSTTTFTLKERWDVDDHNAAALLVLPDNRLMVFYARHNKRGLYCRATLHPEDITSWHNEVTICDAPRLTYSHPVYLKGEGTYYVFFRGESWKPTVCTSQDGRLWSPPQILVQDSGREARDIRPYLKVISDGDSTIHFAFTDGHPRNEAHNSLYYLKYTTEAFFWANGKKVATMSELPIAHNKSECVYDARTTGARAWVWDVAIDDDGLPCIAYTRLPADTDHRYHYIRWTGTGWLDTEVAAGGRWFPETPAGTKEPEPHYSGGMAIVKHNPAVLYLSRQSGEGFVIERWSTPDRGRTWKSRPVPGAQVGLNVRPVVPYGAGGAEDFVLWMTGHYIHFSDFNTEIRMVAPRRH